MAGVASSSGCTGEAVVVMSDAEIMKHGEACNREAAERGSILAWYPPAQRLASARAHSIGEPKSSLWPAQPRGSMA